MTRVIRTVLVDDEPLAREGLRVRLGREEDIEIVGEADDGPSAVNAILALRPDLVFLDVQIPGFDGFDVVSRTASTFLPTIIFVTAYDRYALQAFEVHALDYLLKPIAHRRFQEALRRARHELSRRERESEVVEEHGESETDSLSAVADRLRRLLDERGTSSCGPRRWTGRRRPRTTCGCMWGSGLSRCERRCRSWSGSSTRRCSLEFIGPQSSTSIASVRFAQSGTGNTKSRS